MRSPFRTGQTVGISNDMALLRGTVTEPRFDLGNGEWGVWISVLVQPDFEPFMEDIKSHRCEIDVTYKKGLFRGYTGPSNYEPDGSMEIFVVPDY